jgi:fatty acid desaturase
MTRLQRLALLAVSAPVAAVVLPTLVVVHFCIHGTPLDMGVLDGAISNLTCWCHGVLCMNRQE